MTWKDWALEEIKTSFYGKDSDCAREIGKALEELVDVFDKQAHSGFSANWVVSLFYRLVKWKPLSPLTNNPDEWMKVEVRNGEPLYQNRRCPSLFATESQLKEGQAEDFDYYYKIDKQERAYIDKDCRKIVELPYMPPMEPELLLENRVEKQRFEVEVDLDIFRRLKDMPEYCPIYERAEIACPTCGQKITLIIRLVDYTAMVDEI